MKLSSDDFKHNEMLEKKFSYRANNISPHLKWEDIPSNTKSFAISCNDPDAPVGDWIHWLVFDIPFNINELPQGGPISGIEIKNDYGQEGYGGPAPPSGTHRYFFKVYALDVEKLEGVTKRNFMQKVKEHKIESAEIIGLYKSK
ncbi:MAG: YbhB/YbcL family Raf kinase inhibitor-like protein [Candidatus Hodarchaeota archaeon]